MADVYDALTSERCYKKAFTHKEALKMILEGQCGTFNPLLLQCLQGIADTLEHEFTNNLPPEPENEDPLEAKNKIDYDKLLSSETSTPLTSK